MRAIAGLREEEMGRTEDFEPEWYSLVSAILIHIVALSETWMVVRDLVVLHLRYRLAGAEGRLSSSLMRTLIFVPYSSINLQGWSSDWVQSFGFAIFDIIVAFAPGVRNPVRLVMRKLGRSPRGW